APLFGAQSGVCAGDIYEREDRARELLRNVHRTQCLPVTLRIRQSEIPVDLLLGIAAFLRSNQQHFLTVESRHAANHGRIIGKTPVAMDFAEISEDFLYVIEKIRALRVAGQLSFDP